MDDDIKTSLIGSLGVLLVVILICIVCAMISSYHSKTEWNGGYHIYDNGKWEYQQAVGHRYSTYYMYKCSKCGKVVELDDYYQEVEE